METLEQRITAVEKECEKYGAWYKIQNQLDTHAVTSASWQKTPSTYYEWTLQERSTFLNCHPSQLTKTVILENKRYTKNITTFPSSLYYAPYYAIVVQYVAKVQTETLNQLLRAAYNRAFPDHPRSKTDYQLTWAPESVSEKLTGFPHNGVSAIGCPQDVPVIFAQALFEINPPGIWMGGGTPDMKLYLSVQQAQRAVEGIVLDISTKRLEFYQTVRA